MTREEREKALEVWYDITFDDKRFDEARKISIEALKAEPCEDAISRQAVLGCLTTTKLKKFDFILHAREEIKKLPPVNPQPKEKEIGCWVPVDDEPHEDYECDKCGEIVSTYTANISPYEVYKYCPKCGNKKTEG